MFRSGLFHGNVKQPAHVFERRGFSRTASPTYLTADLVSSEKLCWFSLLGGDKSLWVFAFGWRSGSPLR